MVGDNTMSQETEQSSREGGGGGGLPLPDHRSSVIHLYQWRDAA